MKLENTMSASVEFLICDIIDNYYRWSDSIKMKSGNSGQLANDKDARDVQAEEFKNGITYKVNSKYIKIYTTNKWGQKSVWGFVVRENNTVKCTTSECYFEKGDLLKAATYKQASRNFSRGNILNGQNATHINGPMQPDYPNYKTVWTGAN